MIKKDKPYKLYHYGIDIGSYESMEKTQSQVIKILKCMEKEEIVQCLKVGAFNISYQGSVIKIIEFLDLDLDLKKDIKTLIDPRKQKIYRLIRNLEREVTAYSNFIKFQKKNLKTISDDITLYEGIKNQATNQIEKLLKDLD